jgi:hypothetical protein
MISGNQDIEFAIQALRVGATDLSGQDELARWVELGSTYARSLPPK